MDIIGGKAQFKRVTRRILCVHTVDVILPFHRDDLFLRIAINSVLKSTNVAVRLILIDDRKESTPIVDLDSRITLRTGGVGYAAALNSALPFLQSDYVALMNSDDWSSPERLVKQISALNRSGKSFSICALKKFKGSRIVPALLGEFQGDSFDPRVLLLGAYGANATWLSTREAWIENVNFEDSLISDWLSSFMFLEKLAPIYVNENLYWYRQHATQTTSTESQQRESFRELLDEASLLAETLNVLDKDFEMNFRITAAPYSLVCLPERSELIAAWKYLGLLERLRITGAENLVLRRRFFVSLKLLQRGYLRFDTLTALLIGSIEIVSSVIRESLTRIPSELKNAKPELVQP